MSAADRFDRFVSPEPTSGCWLWTGALWGKGYGVFWDGKKYVAAHRWIYQQAKGQIPPGREIDHLCRVRCCVNPQHLEAVTHHENLLRGDTIAALKKRQTKCKHGHTFDAENTLLSPEGRRCRKCRLLRNRTYKARRKLREVREDAK